MCVHDICVCMVSVCMCVCIAHGSQRLMSGVFLIYFSFCLFVWNRVFYWTIEFTGLANPRLARQWGPGILHPSPTSYYIYYTCMLLCSAFYMGTWVLVLMWQALYLLNPFPTPPKENFAQVFLPSLPHRFPSLSSLLPPQPPPNPNSCS